MRTFNLVFGGLMLFAAFCGLATVLTATSTGVAGFGGACGMFNLMCGVKAIGLAVYGKDDEQ
jgi:hypothetical protein